MHGRIYNFSAVIVFIKVERDWRVPHGKNASSCIFGVGLPFCIAEEDRIEFKPLRGVHCHYGDGVCGSAEAGNFNLRLRVYNLVHK